MPHDTPGRVFVWEGGSLWIGRTEGATDTHAHHALQVSLALEGTFRLKTGADDPWTAHAAVLVPPHVPHAFHAADAVAASLFVEPEAEVGRRLLERFGHRGVVPLPEAAAAEAAAPLAAAYADGWDEARHVAAAHEAVRRLTGGAAPRHVVDARIEKAIALVRARLHEPVSQEAVAAAVFLSPSRFRHLFVEETGMAFRPYVLWLRLQRALEAHAAGASLTEAAHAAGFADLAHLSRTFRRMFGITPAVLKQIDAFGPARPRRA